MTGHTCETPNCTSCDALWNSIAVASVGYQQSVMNLRNRLLDGRRNGFTLVALMDVSGLPVSLIGQLLDAAEPF